VAGVPDFLVLAEAMEVAIFIVQGSIVVWANPAATRLIGYSREDLSRMPFWDLLHPEYRTVGKARGLARQEGVQFPAHLEYRMVAKDGATLWVDFSAVRIEYLGEPAMLGTATDITARKRTEEALRQSEQRLRRLVDSHILGVIIGGFDGRIREANQAILDMLGYTADAPPTRWDEITPPEWRSADVEARESLRTTGVAAPREKEYFHRDGHRVPVMIGSARVAPGEEAAISFIVDLTDRKRAERALAESLAELRVSQETLRRFAAREVAGREAERKRLGFDLHDNVCQELTGVGMMIASVRGRVGPERGDLALELDRAGRFLDELIEHLRLLARELRPLQLHDLGLEESLRSFAVRMSSPTAAVRTEVPEPLAPVGEEIEVAVYRVAQEAVTNALRHGAPRTVVLTVRTGDHRLRLEVRDDGCGFDTEARPAEALGLISMEERALALGGSFTVRSSPGAGTTVTFECPVPPSLDR
jgi:PAS domain S-box-containing protein